MTHAPHSNQQSAGAARVSLHQNAVMRGDDTTRIMTQSTRMRIYDAVSAAYGKAQETLCAHNESASARKARSNALDSGSCKRACFMVVRFWTLFAELRARKSPWSLKFFSFSGWSQ